MSNPTWPASCRMLYSSIAEAMREANLLHKAANECTYLKYSILPIGKGNRVFSISARIEFCRGVEKDEIQRNLLGVNTLNELMNRRVVFVDVVKGQQAASLGNPRNPIELVFRATVAGSEGVYAETGVFYSDDGTLANDDASTWSSDLAGKDISLYLTQGTVLTWEFPTRN